MEILKLKNSIIKIKSLLDILSSSRIKIIE